MFSDLTDVGTRLCLGLIKSPVFAFHLVAKDKVVYKRLKIVF